MDRIGRRLFEAAFDLIDHNTNDKLTNLIYSKYIENLSEYILNGYVEMQKASKYLKPLVDLDNKIRRSQSHSSIANVSTGVGFRVPSWIQHKIFNTLEKRSVMLSKINIIKTEEDTITVPYHNVNRMRWPGEPVLDTERLKDPESEFIKVSLQVALLCSFFSSDPKIVRVKSIEDDYIESNIESLIEYFDQAILYGDGQGKIGGLYPRSINDDTLPNYGYIVDVDKGVYSEHFIQIKNSMPVKYRDNAYWIMSKDMGRKVTKMRDNRGELFIHLEDHLEIPYSILGIPVIYNDYMDSDDNSNSVPIMLVNLDKAYTFIQGIKTRGPSVRRFEEPLASEKEQVMALTRYRWGGKLTNPDAIRVLRVKNTEMPKAKEFIVSEIHRIYSNETELKEKLEIN